MPSARLTQTTNFQILTCTEIESTGHHLACIHTESLDVHIPRLLTMKLSQPVQSKIEQFSLKMYKISEQQINPKVLSVANSCLIMKILKKAKIVYRQMPAPWELPPQISPTPEQKLGCKSPRVGANFWCISPAVHR